MSSILVNDALSKVWCNPFQDLQFIVEPARITPSQGAVGTFLLMWDIVNLPTPSDTYHVFQLGPVDPDMINLEPGTNVWHSFTEIMRNQKMVACLYNRKGWMVPRFEAWVLSYIDGNLIVAVKDQQPFENFGVNNLFVRLYSNAWLNGGSGAAAPVGVYTAGLRVTSSTGAVGLQNTAAAYQNMPGSFQWFHNGYYVDSVPPSNIAAGDTVEFVYDASVRAVIDFPVNSLSTFQSTVDSLSKYILHQPLPMRNTIDYRDDIDLYVVNPNGLKYEAIYFHKNNDNALRQLTQQDYAIPVNYVEVFANDQMWNVDNLVVRMFVRNGGFAGRPLTYENNRIFELYKLPTDAEILEALSGLHSNVPNWQAATLESSPYVEIMDASYLTEVTQDEVQAAYGYNAISKLTANTPLLIQQLGQGPGVPLPIGLQNTSTVFEYDTNRKLIGMYNHTAGAIYYPVNAGCYLIEAIIGTGGTDSGVVIYQAPSVIALNPAIGQRVYFSNNINGQISNAWADITDNTDFYTVSTDGTVGTFVVNTTDYFIAVVGDDMFLAYEFAQSATDGTIIFDVQGQVDYPGNVEGTGPLNIQPGVVDVWLNGNSLVPNVDFFVEWPQISICNLSFVAGDPSQPQNIAVRCTGFQDSRSGPGNVIDSGYIQYNVLSRNNVFNIRDDKVTRIVAGGKVYLQSELAFDEGGGAPTLPGNLPNGSPYIVEEIIVPLRDQVDTTTYAMRSASLVIDAAVSAYLSMKLPDTVESVPDQITSLYKVYSPFFTKILSDVVSGAISMTNFSGLYSDTDVKNALASYNTILQMDPIYNNIDSLHVDVVPHPWATAVQVGAYQYKFLQAVNRAFLGGQLDLSTYVVITASGLPVTPV